MITLGADPAALTVAAPAGTATGVVVVRSQPVLTLKLLDFDLTVQPGVLRADVGNGLPGQRVYFYIGNSDEPFQSATLDTYGAARVQLWITGQPTGPNRIRVAGETPQV